MNPLIVAFGALIGLIIALIIFCFIGSKLINHLERLGNKHDTLAFLSPYLIFLAGAVGYKVFGKASK